MRRETVNGKAFIYHSAFLSLTTLTRKSGAALRELGGIRFNHFAGYFPRSFDEATVAEKVHES